MLTETPTAPTVHSELASLKRVQDDITAKVRPKKKTPAKDEVRRRCLEHVPPLHGLTRDCPHSRSAQTPSGPSLATPHAPPSPSTPSSHAWTPTTTTWRTRNLSTGSTATSSAGEGAWVSRRCPASPRTPSGKRVRRLAPAPEREKATDSLHPQLQSVSSSSAPSCFSALTSRVLAVIERLERSHPDAQGRLALQEALARKVRLCSPSRASDHLSSCRAPSSSHFTGTRPRDASVERRGPARFVEIR